MPIDRREFLAGIGGFGLGLGLGGVSHWLPLPVPEVGPDWNRGDQRFVSSTCMLCPAHCGIRGRVMDGSLVSIAGNPMHPVSRGGLCAKGVSGIQLLYHPGRLTGPVERIGPPGSAEFKSVSWDYALEKVASTLTALRDQGDTSSLMWLTGRTPGLMGELIQRFSSACGTPDVIREDDSDGANRVLALSQGIDAPPAFDLDSAGYVLSFGVPLFESWEGLPQASAARNHDPGKGPRWVQLDVRHSRTAARSHEWVGVAPGTYGSLAFGLAYVILKEGIYDAERVRDTMIGLEDSVDENGEPVPGFRSLVVHHGRTEVVARTTGVDPETIVRLAKEFATARQPVAVWDHAVAWRTGGLADALAIHSLNLLVGSLDRPGGVLIQPSLPVKELHPSALPVREHAAPLSRENWAKRIGSGSVTAPGALFLYYSNPVASSPDGDSVVMALEKIPFVVSFSPFFDESAKHANLVLPDCTYLERWQDAPAPSSVPIPVWGIVQPMVEPLHDTRATGDVLLDLAARIGGTLAEGTPAGTFEDLVQERGRALATARRGGVFGDEWTRGELRELESRGWWVPHGQSDSDFWSDLQERGGWFDPYYDYHDRSMFSRFSDGKARLWSVDARRAIGLSDAEIKSGSQPLRLAPTSDEAGYTLRLIPYRVMTFSSGGTTLTPWLMENLGLMTGNAWETWIELNPSTAQEAGLKEGQIVSVESKVGQFRSRVRLFAGTQPGAVNVPYGLHTKIEGWGAIDGSNPLRATGNRIDPVTGLPDWYSTLVRLVPA